MQLSIILFASSYFSVALSKLLVILPHKIAKIASAAPVAIDKIVPKIINPKSNVVAKRKSETKLVISGSLSSFVAD